MQLIEYFYFEAARRADSSRDKQSQGKGGKGARQEEAAIFSSKHRDYGECMVAPDLLDKELERDSAVMKQMRKAREERDLASKRDGS